MLLFLQVVQTAQAIHGESYLQVLALTQGVTQIYLVLKSVGCNVYEDFSNKHHKVILSHRSPYLGPTDNASLDTPNGECKQAAN